jgi:hypothetical protein
MLPGARTFCFFFVFCFLFFFCWHANNTQPCPPNAARQRQTRPLAEQSRLREGLAGVSIAIAIAITIVAVSGRGCIRRLLRDQGDRLHRLCGTYRWPARTRRLHAAAPFLPDLLPRVLFSRATLTPPRGRFHSTSRRTSPKARSPTGWKRLMRELAYLHANNMHHCRVQPANVLVFADGHLRVASLGTQPEEPLAHGSTAA